MLICFVAAAIAAELAWSRRYAAVLLVPPLGLLFLVALLSPKAGPVPLCGRRLRHDCLGGRAPPCLHRPDPAASSRRAGTERGANALVASVLGLVAILPVAVGAPFGDSDRFDVRELRNDTSTIDEEISAALAARRMALAEPGADLVHRDPGGPRTPGGGSSPSPATTAGPGCRPTTSARSARSSEHIDPRSPAQRFDVTVGHLEEAWAPFTGEPIETDLPARVDPHVLRASASPTGSPPADEYQLTVVDPVVDPTPAELQYVNRRLPAPTCRRSPTTGRQRSRDADAGGEDRRGNRPPTTSGRCPWPPRRRWRPSTNLDDDAPAGHSLPQLQLFLTSTKAGTRRAVRGRLRPARPIDRSAGAHRGRGRAGAEQVRPLDGQFQPPSSPGPRSTFIGLGWVPFDPFPRAARRTAAEPAGASGRGVRSGGAPPPTTAAEPVRDAGHRAEETTFAGDGSLSVAARFGLVGILLFLALVAYVATVLTMKRNRRLRRAQAMRADVRITGAFLSSVDLAVDLGATTGQTLTNRELAMTSATGRRSRPPSRSTSWPGWPPAPSTPPEEPGTEVADLAWEQARRVSNETARSAGRFRWMQSAAQFAVVAPGRPGRALVGRPGRRSVAVRFVDLDLVDIDGVTTASVSIEPGASSLSRWRRGRVAIGNNSPWRRPSWRETTSSWVTR